MRFSVVLNQITANIIIAQAHFPVGHSINLPGEFFLFITKKNSFPMQFVGYFV